MPTEKIVEIGSIKASNSGRLFYIAGLCSLESEDMLLNVALKLKKAFDEADIPWILKCSFDKANRSSVHSFRGLGMEKGLRIFSKIKKAVRVPMLTDVHETHQVPKVAKVVEILQVPAFLCRQTDLLVACGKTGNVVNIKKGQFLSPWEIRNAIEKVESTGNQKITLTERGTSFGYNNLVVDMRSLEIMRGFGYPIIYDATHSVQLPGGMGTSTGGERRFAAPLARAAAAVGIAGVFLETHPDPDKARSDGPNSIPLKDVPELLKTLSEIDRVVKRHKIPA